jgi:hypothetical protein
VFSSSAVAAVKWGGGVPHWGLFYQEKGLVLAAKYFSGNGVSLAAMCTVLNEYRPSDDQGGGTVDRRLTPILTATWVL